MDDLERESATYNGLPVTGEDLGHGCTPGVVTQAPRRAHLLLLRTYLAAIIQEKKKRANTGYEQSSSEAVYSLLPAGHMRRVLITLSNGENYRVLRAHRVQLARLIYYVSATDAINY